MTQATVHADRRDHLSVMALVHAYRIVTHFQVIVGSHTIAQGVSWVALIVTLAWPQLRCCSARRGARR